MAFFFNLSGARRQGGGDTALYSVTVHKLYISELKQRTVGPPPIRIVQVQYIHTFTQSTHTHTQYFFRIFFFLKKRREKKEKKEEEGKKKKN